MANILKATIFVRKRDPSPDSLNKLVVRGGSEAVRDHLEKNVLGGVINNPLATGVFTLDYDEGRIKSSRWQLLGPLKNKGLSIRAKNVWEKAEDNIFLQIKTLDLAAFQFPGKGGNFSYWLDSAEVEHIVIDKNKTPLSKEEAVEKGVGDFCVRAGVIPCGPQEANLVVGLIPANKDEVKRLCPEGYNKSGCPQILLCLGDGTTRAKVIPMMVPEARDKGWGMGTLPLMEWTSDEDILLPSAKDYRLCTHEHMRKVKMMNSKSAKSIMNALEDPAEYDKEPALPSIWPEAQLGDDPETRHPGELSGNKCTLVVT